jgi:hypothetical protein
MPVPGPEGQQARYGGVDGYWFHVEHEGGFRPVFERRPRWAVIPLVGYWGPIYQYRGLGNATMTVNGVIRGTTPAFVDSDMQQLIWLGYNGPQELQYYMTTYYDVLLKDVRPVRTIRSDTLAPEEVVWRFQADFVMLDQV